MNHVLHPYTTLPSTVLLTWGGKFSFVKMALSGRPFLLCSGDHSAGDALVTSTGHGIPRPHGLPPALRFASPGPLGSDLMTGFPGFKGVVAQCSSLAQESPSSPYRFFLAAMSPLMPLPEAIR
jgi:hypothetical protein